MNHFPFLEQFSDKYSHNSHTQSLSQQISQVDHHLLQKSSYLVRLQNSHNVLKIPSGSYYLTCLLSTLPTHFKPSIINRLLQIDIFYLMVYG